MADQPISRSCASRRHAFSLIELVIVVLVIGILAGVAAPAMLDNSQRAAKSAFIRQLTVYYNAVERYQLEHQEFPANVLPGRIPTELQPYLRSQNFSAATPFGGSWDYETSSYGFTAAVGVVFPSGEGTLRTAVMTEIDAIIDDGDLSTGRFQVKAGGNRFYWIQR